jgi:hypothetical protein
MGTVIPLADGDVATWNKASGAGTRPRARVDPGAFPPSARLEVMAMATRKPATDYGPATRWRLDALVAALGQRRTWTRSRSSLWRMLAEADRTPPRSVSWLHSHDPDGEAKAHDLCSFALNARRVFAPGRLGLCSDAKPGRPMLECKDPTQPMDAGKPEQRAHEDMRHGTRALIASCMVPTGQGVWHLGETRTSADCAAHLAPVVKQLPAMNRDDWVLDHLHTPWSLDVCRVVAQVCQGPCVAKDRSRGGPRRAFLRDPSQKHGGHCTPKHGSWLNQVALGFRVLARRLLPRGACCAAQDFATRLGDSLAVSHTPQAHPYRWTYPGQPLVRATPLSQTRRQQRQGRAWVSSRPQRFERAVSPPRPYKRAAASLAANLRNRHLDTS